LPLLLVYWCFQSGDRHAGPLQQAEQVGGSGRGLDAVAGGGDSSRASRAGRSPPADPASAEWGCLPLGRPARRAGGFVDRQRAEPGGAGPRPSGRRLCPGHYPGPCPEPGGACPGASVAVPHSRPDQPRAAEPARGWAGADGQPGVY